MTSLAAAVLLAFSACSQDEIVGGDDSLLPDDAYPLQIGSLSIVAQSSEEPWTRVAENTTDGNSSVWETGDVIGVRLDGDPSYFGENAPIPFTERGEYIINRNDGSLYISPYGEEIYWEYTYAGINSQRTYNGKTWYMGGVTAWYPTDESVVLGDQSERLAYILEGHEKTPNNNGSYYPDDEIPLEFKHLLAKVRVELEGVRASAVNKVEVYSYTSCTHTEVPPTTYTAPYRKISTDGAQQGWITMHNPTEYGDGMYWEANLVPGTIQNNYIRLNGTTIVPLSSLTELKAGKLHTVAIKVNAYPSDATQITSTTSSISGDGNYYVTGNLTSAINITGGSPHIYLYGASISAQTPISIKGNSTATIHVAGDNNAVTSTSGTGILVEKGSTLILTSGSTDNVITVRGRNYNTSKDYPGIGGNHSGDCGTIRIENVTVHAYGDGTFACAPGIGPSQNYSCEGIVIKEAVVYAYGTGHNSLAAPGIGSSMHGTSAAIGAIPKMEISNSTIHAVRGGVVADFIGRAGWKNDPASSEVNPGTGGSIKSSIIHCYTGNTNTLNKTVVYDANGNGTEQSQ